MANNNNNNNAADDYLWDPPLRKASLKDDYGYPFSLHFFSSNIPESVRQNALPPVCHVLDLAFPTASPPLAL